MDKVSVRLTVFFEEPFWVGVFERISGGGLSACRVVFGAEPKEYEVYDFIQEHYAALRFSPAVAAAAKGAGRNPKRILRQARRQMEGTGVGTKAQQALKLQQEQRKTERVSARRDRREAEREQRFELKQQKKKEKHRGR